MNKLVVIVGLGKGFGLSLINVFLEKEYDIVLLNRNTEELNWQFQNSYETGRIHIIHTDVTSSDSIINAFDKIKEIKQSIALLIYNAVTRRISTPSQLTSEIVTDDLQVNLGGAITTTNLILPLLKKQNSGAIIYTGGGVALTPSLSHSSMSIGKAALRNYALNLANEMADTNIYIGTITITQPIREDTVFSPEYIANQYFNLFISQTKIELVI